MTTSDAVHDEDDHDHGPRCAHEAVAHGDDTDCAHDGHRHASHDGHQDRH
jgi:hypothetical protein